MRCKIQTEMEIQNVDIKMGKSTWATIQTVYIYVIQTLISVTLHPTKRSCRQVNFGCKSILRKLSLASKFS